MTGKRVRLLGLVISPHLVIDDGENLTPIHTTDPLTVPATQLENLPTLIRAALADIQGQLDAEEKT